MNFPPVLDTPSGFEVSSSRENSPPPPRSRARISTESDAPHLEDTAQLEQDLIEYFASMSLGSHGCKSTESTRALPGQNFVFSTPQHRVAQPALTMTSPLDRAYTTLPGPDDLQDEMEEYLAFVNQHSGHAFQEFEGGTPFFSTPPRSGSSFQAYPVSPLDRAYTTLPGPDDLQEEMEEYLASADQQASHALLAAVGDGFGFTTPPRSVADARLLPVSPLDRSYDPLPDPDVLQPLLDAYLAQARQGKGGYFRDDTGGQ